MKQYLLENRTGKNAWKYSLKPDDGHVPTKDENMIIRRIMAEKGLSREQVLSEKKYRKEIAQYLKDKSSSKRTFISDRKKMVSEMWRAARRKTGLVNDHPLTKLEFNRLYRLCYDNYLIGPSHLSKKDLDYITDNNIPYLGVVHGGGVYYITENNNR
jgi:hypothetical protein